MKPSGWIALFSLTSIVLILIDIYLKWQGTDVQWLFPLALGLFGVSLYLRYRSKKTQQDD